MAIIVIEDRKVLTSEKADFEREKLEEFLRTSIADNPEIIDLKELDENLRTFIVGTEFDSIDVLGIDQYGNIYIIETKLFKNPDKRHVVAQVLDYAACLWRDYGGSAPEAAGRFWGKAEQRSRKFHPGVSLDERLKEFVGSPTGDSAVDEDAEEGLQDVTAELKSRIESNLRERRFRIVVVMDKLHDDIKNHIAFLNDVTNEDFWVLGVELEFYGLPKYGNLQIVAPTMFGNESQEKRIEARSGTAGEVWNEEKFLEEVDELDDEKTVSAVKDLYEFVKNKGAASPWPRSTSKYPRFTFPVQREGRIRSLFKVTKDDKGITITFCFLQFADWRSAWQDAGLIRSNDPPTEAQRNLGDIVNGVGLDKFKQVAEELAAGGSRKA